MLPMVYMALVDDEDVPAFEKMYERTYKKLYSIAYGIVKDHSQAEDALYTYDFFNTRTLYFGNTYRVASVFKVYRGTANETIYVYGDTKTV